MKEAKPYWYSNMAYSMEPYSICPHFPQLIKVIFIMFTFPIIQQCDLVQLIGRMVKVTITSPLQSLNSN